MVTTKVVQTSFQMMEHPTVPRSRKRPLMLRRLRVRVMQKLEIAPGPMFRRKGTVMSWGSGASGLGNMADYLRSLVNNKLMSDVAFLVEGSEVFAHRCICMRCDYFKITLAEEIVNSNVGRVEISGVSRRAFLSVLEYIYTDSLDVSEDMVMEMFTTADRFGIETLKQHCSRRLMKSVGVHNVADVLLIADELGHASLRDECFAYTLRNLEAVSKTKSFQEMAHRNPNMMVKIVQELSART